MANLTNKTIKFMKGPGLLVAYKGASMVLGLAIVVLLARMMPLVDFGRYSYLYSWLGVLLILVELGMPSYLLREVSRCQSKIQVSNVFYSAFFLILISSLGLVGMTALGNALLRWGSDQLVVLSSFALSTFFLAIMRTLGGYLQGRQLVLRGNFAELIFRPAVFLLGLLISSWWLGDVQIWLVGLLLLVSCVSGASLSFLLLSLKLPVPAWKDFESTQFVQLFKPGIVFALTSGVVLLNQNLDILMLGSLLDISDVAIYRPPSKIAFVIGTFGFALALYYKPKMAKLAHQEQKEKMEQMVAKLVLGSVVASIPLVLLLCLFPEHALSVFGKDYLMGGEILMVLCLGHGLSSPLIAVTNLLLMTGNEGSALVCTLTAVILNCALNLILIPIYGGLGAAMATSVGLVAWHLLGGVLLFRNTGINAVPVRHFAKAFR